jgi:membrane protein EpsK
MPWSRIAWLVDVELLRAQTAYGAWAVINFAGALLYLQIDLLVINRILGPEAGGRYAALAQWSFLIRSLGGTVAAVMGPTVLHLYARGDHDELLAYSRRGVLGLGIFLALPVGLVSGLAGPLLTLWLGTAYTEYAGLLALMVLPLSINVAVTPLFAVQSAANAVRVPAIVTLVMGLGNVLLAIAATHRFGIYGAAIAGGVMLTSKNVLFTPVYTARALGRGWASYFDVLLRALALSLVVAAAGYVVSAFAPLVTWAQLVLAAAGLAVLYAPLAWFGAFTRADRNHVREQWLGPALALVRGAPGARRS